MAPRRRSARQAALNKNGPSSITSHLSIIGLSLPELSNCSTLDDEFALIKKTYFRGILKAHPDKGGSVEAFRILQTSFELLRDFFNAKSVSSFCEDPNAPLHRAHANDEYDDEEGEEYRPDSNSYSTSSSSMPSWEFYADAAEYTVPIYKVELAKSNRSACIKKCAAGKIEKGAIRFGSINMETGSYGRWIHLECWRVPSKIWAGLPDPDTCTDKARFHKALLSMDALLFCGLDALQDEEIALVVKFVMNKSNWAKRSKRAVRSENTPPEEKVKRSIMDVNQEETTMTSEKSKQKGNNLSKSKKPKTESIKKENGKKKSSHQNQLAVVGESSNQLVVSASSSTSIVVVKKTSTALILPHTEMLRDKTVVMTGVFPQVGGGAGLSLGKARLRSMLEKLGAKVRSSVSGKTDILLVGKSPGAGKVGTARSKPTCQLIGIHDLKLAIENNTTSIEAIAAPEIRGYSAGYHGNGLAMLEG